MPAGDEGKITDSGEEGEVQFQEKERWKIEGGREGLMTNERGCAKRDAIFSKLVQQNFPFSPFLPVV